MKSIAALLLSLSLTGVFAVPGLGAAQPSKKAAPAAHKQSAAADSGDKGAVVVQLDRATKFPYSEGKVAFALPDGKMLIGCAVHANAKDVHAWDNVMGLYGRHVYFALIRLDASGAMDQSFGDNGLAVADLGKWSGRPHKIMVQPDGKIVVVGNTTSTWYPVPTFPDSTYAVVRFTADGHPDPTYGVNGILQKPKIPGFFYMSAAMQPDGKLIVGGGVKSRNPDTFHLFRLNVDGTVDLTFNETGIPKDFSAEHIRAIAVGKNGAIWLMGQLGVGYIYAKAPVAKLLPDGNPDPAFGYHGYMLLKNAVGGVFADGYAVADDKFIMVGVWNGAYQAVRIAPNGTLDATYGKGGVASVKLPVGQTGDLSSTVSSAGDIYVGGSYPTGVNYKWGFRFTHLKANGAANSALGPGGFATANVTVDLSYPTNNHAMTLTSDGRIVVAGYESDTIEEGNASHNEVKAKIVTLRR
jgi:uncharacterized delta-60 repeat protein